MSVSHQLIGTCFTIIALGSTTAAASDTGYGMHAAARSGDAVQITDLRPFTHVAYVPYGADLSSIKIEGVEVVKVATKRRSVTNAYYCEQRWSDPGGSMDCQRVTDESYVPAYRVKYSYRGPSMASDEYGNTYFTFSVYFRPDEIGPGLRRAASSGRIGRTASAEFFRVTTSRESMQQAGVMRASPYVTVKVDAIPPSGPKGRGRKQAVAEVETHA